MITVGEITKARNAASPLNIIGARKSYKRGDNKISCFFKYDCNNKVYGFKKNPFSKSRILNGLCEDKE